MPALLLLGCREVGSPTASSSETNVLLWRVLSVLAVLLVLVWLLG